MTAKEIIHEVCNYFHVGTDYIETNERFGEIIKIKHLAVYFVKKYKDYSLAATGRYFIGNNLVFDHASVLHAVRSVNNQYDTDRHYRNQVDELNGIIESKMRDYEYQETEDVWGQNDFFKN